MNKQLQLENLKGMNHLTDRVKMGRSPDTRVNAVAKCREQGNETSDPRKCGKFIHYVRDYSG
jgi:hypothetical protein